MSKISKMISSHLVLDMPAAGRGGAETGERAAVVLAIGLVLLDGEIDTRDGPLADVHDVGGLLGPEPDHIAASEEESVVVVFFHADVGGGEIVEAAANVNLPRPGRRSRIELIISMLIVRAVALRHGRINGERAGKRRPRRDGDGCGRGDGIDGCRKVIRVGK